MIRTIFGFGLQVAEGRHHPRGATRLPAAFLALSLGLSIAACGDGGTSGGGGAEVPPGPGGGYTPATGPTTRAPVSGGSGGSAPTARGPDAGCSLKWQRRVLPTTTVYEELQYLDDIVVCVNEATGSMSITNNSDMVWAFHDSAPATEIRPQVQDAAIFEFHTLAKTVYPYGFMAPKEQVSVDGGSTTVEWAIHPELSAAWTANGFLLKQISKKGSDALRAAMAGDSATRRAIWDCTTAVFNVGAAVPKIIESPQYDPAEQISTGLGIVTSSGPCAKSWTAAEREAGTAKMSSWRQIVQETSSALKPAEELAEKSAHLKVAVTGTLPLIRKLFHR